MESRDGLIGLLDSLRRIGPSEQTDAIRRHFDERLHAVPAALRDDYNRELQNVLPCFPGPPQPPVNAPPVEASLVQAAETLVDASNRNQSSADERAQVVRLLQGAGFAFDPARPLSPGLCQAMGLPPGTVVGTERLQHLTERLAKSVEGIIRATMGAWWKLPPDALLEPLTPFRFRLREVMQLGDAEFDRALDELLGPLGLAKALLSATREAADVFAAHHHHKFTAREIKNVVAIDGYATEKALWRRFEKTSESWNQQAFCDWFRRAVMESVLNSMECRTFLDDLKNKTFKDRPWPWASA